MKVLTDNKYYNEIAGIIREQNGTSNTYKPPQIVQALKDIFYEEAEGVPPIYFNGIGKDLLDYRIDGANGGVGDLITNISDTNYNKYKVPIIVKGKNIYNETLYPITSGKFINAKTGVVSNNSAYSATLDYIPCSQYVGKTMILNKRPGGANTGIAYYDINQDFISGTKNDNGTEGTPMTFVIPANAEYMRFTIPSNETEIQIEFGNISTNYEQYVEPITANVYLNSPILEGESISKSDTNISIPTIKGTNILVVDTQVPPNEVYVKSRKT